MTGLSLELIVREEKGPTQGHTAHPWLLTPYLLRATQGKPDVLFLHAPATRLRRRGPQSELLARSLSTAPSPSHSLLADLPNYREKKILWSLPLLNLSLEKKKNSSPTPQFPASLGSAPAAGRHRSNHLANRKFQRPRHICVLSAFSG